ncbi:MAG TPA: universal stress protein [Blastocatellia bacterium]|nr:universal stress protein [Blastocatellia bacterium]
MRVKDVLVPTDFSANSLRAIDFAVAAADRDGEVCLLHVIDSDFINRLSDEGFSEAEPATTRMRRRAEDRMREIIQTYPEPRPRMESMVVIGKPFTEILRVAADLDFEMLVMGIHGMRGENIEDLLFGTTAEKVLRAVRIPVVCVPDITLQ